MMTKGLGGEEFRVCSDKLAGWVRGATTRLQHPASNITSASFFVALARDSSVRSNNLHFYMTRKESKADPVHSMQAYRRGGQVLLHPFLTSALHTSECAQLHVPAALPRRKNHWIRLGGPQSPCKRFGEFCSPCWEPNPKSSSPSPSQYTKYALPAPVRFNSHSGNWLLGLRGFEVFLGTSWTIRVSASTRPQSVSSKSFPIRHSPITLQ